MSVREFKPVWYWISKIDFIDKLIIRGYKHNEAHQISRKFFLERNYTHLLIACEDVMYTPDHIKLLLCDAYKNNFKIISCTSNWDFINDWLNITFKDMRGVNVYTAYAYNFIKLKELLKYQTFENKYFPYVKVKFVGLPLTLIDREVVEKVEFKPYKYVQDWVLGRFVRRGIMHDLQFSIDVLNKGYDIIVDTRCLLLHFGKTTEFISKRRREQKIVFVKASKSLNLQSECKKY
jgi:hypothetical protein